MDRKACSSKFMPDFVQCVKIRKTKERDKFMARVTPQEIEKFKNFKFDTSKYIFMDLPVTRDIKTGALILKEQKPVKTQKNAKQ
jgi:hypothetical protein